MVTPAASLSACQQQQAAGSCVLGLMTVCVLSCRHRVAVQAAASAGRRQAGSLSAAAAAAVPGQGVGGAATGGAWRPHARSSCMCVMVTATGSSTTSPQVSVAANDALHHQACPPQPRTGTTGSQGRCAALDECAPGWQGRRVVDERASGVAASVPAEYGSKPWVNPVLSKALEIKASSPPSRYTDPKVGGCPATARPCMHLNTECAVLPWPRHSQAAEYL